MSAETSKKPGMNLPNKLTVARLCCVPFFLALLLLEFPYHILCAGIVFALAMITDLLDGKIARRYNMVTEFGKFWDPLADKLMTITALIGIAALNDAPVLATVVACVVLWRELFVTGLRVMAAKGSGKVIAANIWGKLKTTFQCVYIALELLALFFVKDLNLSENAFFSEKIQSPFNIVIFAAGCIMVALTLWSAWTYYRDNKESFHLDDH